MLTTNSQLSRFSFLLASTFRDSCKNSELFSFGVLTTEDCPITHLPASRFDVGPYTLLEMTPLNGLARNAYAKKKREIYE